MQIQLNGESRAIEPGTTIAQLLTEMELDNRGLAVERNLEVVPREEHAQVMLEEGDRLEVVTLVGGG